MTLFEYWGPVATEAESMMQLQATEDKECQKVKNQGKKPGGAASRGFSANTGHLSSKAGHTFPKL